MSNDREQWLQQRAYAIWEVEGRPDGRDREHWEQAERELSTTPVTEQDTLASAANAEPIVESTPKKPRRTGAKATAATVASRKKKPPELRP